MLRDPKEMTPETRTMVFRVIDGLTSETMLHLMHQVCNFTRRDEILQWLLRNSLVGDPLLNWFKHEFGFRVFPMAKYILTTIDKTKKDKILYGIDWRPQ
jgi:hypothetical protein